MIPLIAAFLAAVGVIIKNFRLCGKKYKDKEGII